MESWYFAYGSNLWPNQMRMRTGAVEHVLHPPRVARLENHHLVFEHLAGSGPAYANILPGGEGVLGVIYRCNEADLERLDRYERGYDRQHVVVTDQASEAISAIVYIMRPHPATRAGRPNADYLQRIVQGAQQHRLPAEYIEGIMTRASR
jgi:gamma-glutamylcyclotransferase (GGCT)/AIG2-like uncharacterized protein YtfP